MGVPVRSLRRSAITRDVHPTLNMVFVAATVKLFFYYAQGVSHPNTNGYHFIVLRYYPFFLHTKNPTLCLQIIPSDGTAPSLRRHHLSRSDRASNSAIPTACAVIRLPHIITTLW
jgi:hypothetical protein